MRAMRRGELDRELVSGWRKISELAGGLSIPGAKIVAAMGALPVAYIDGIPVANPSLLKAYAERRAKKRERTEQRIEALAEAIEA